MKCIRCRIDSNHRERRATGGRCRNCGRAFAFEPRSGDALTDLAFLNAIDAVSDDGRLAWRDRHLYYEVCRRVRRRRVLHRLLRRRLVSIDWTRFERMLVKWAGAHDYLPGRLEGRLFERGTVDPAAASDVAHYAFETVVICDDEDVADVLLVNGFHREYRCPVVSARGYPHGAAQALTSVFRERPPRRALVVHDANWTGCRLAEEVAPAPWFSGHEVEIVDIGMRPADAVRFSGLYLHAEERGVPSGSITEEEAEWLRTYRLELEAVRPRTLMAVIGRAVRADAERKEERPDSVADGGGLVLWDETVWDDADEDVG